VKTTLLVTLGSALIALGDTPERWSTPPMTPRAVPPGPPRERLPTGIRILVGAGFLVAIGYGIVTPALPVFARSFGVGVAAASTVISAFAVFRLVFAPASGVLINRLGELRVFCGGLLIVGSSSAACAYAADFGQLLMFRAVGGIGSTMFTVAAAALLLRTAPPKMRGRAAGSWATGFLLGGIGGPVLGGGLVALGPRAPFLVYAGVLGCVVVVAGVALRGPGARRAGPEQPTASGPTVAAAMRHATFRAALTSNFLQGWTVYGVRVALVPLFIVDGLGWSSTWAGAALTAFAVGTAATSPVGGRLADRHGRRPPILTGLVTVAATMCWLGVSTSPVEMMAAALLSGAGTGLTNPPTNAAAADVVAMTSGAAGAGPPLAAYQMVGDVGAIAGPVLAGLVAEWSGYPIAFGLTAAVAAVSFASWYRAPETGRGDRPVPRT
jgi:MFS transporter, DHA1 family, tetracycline resistance protein